MGVLTNVIEIAAPPQAVWDVLLEVETMAEWMTVHDGFPEDPSGQLEPGFRFKEKVKIIGMSGEVSWKVVDFEPPEFLRLEGKGTGGTKLKAAYRIEPAGDGSRLSYESELGGLALRPIKGRVEKEANAAGKESLENLRDLIEARG